jgi:hypothetical protein
MCAAEKRQLCAIGLSVLSRPTIRLADIAQKIAEGCSFDQPKLTWLGSLLGWENALAARSEL